MPTFNANVITRQYADRPWWHFNIKPNDQSFDSTAGLQDILDYEGIVTLPDGVFYTDTINYSGEDSILIAKRPWVYPRYPGHANDFPVEGKGTVLRYNGAGGTDSIVVNMSSHSTWHTNSTPGELTRAKFQGIAIDCDGNRVTAGTHDRAADGMNTAEYGLFIGNCGNAGRAVAENFGIYASEKCALVATDLYTAAIKNFQIGFNEDMPWCIGGNLKDRWTTTRLCYELKVSGFDVRYCGNWTQQAAITPASRSTKGGSFSTEWNLVTAASAYQNGAALTIMGRGSVLEKGSYQLTGGPLICGNGGFASNRGQNLTVRDIYTEYITALQTGFNATTRQDYGIAVLALQSDNEVGNLFENIYFGGNGLGQSLTPFGKFRLSNVTYGTGLTPTFDGTDATAGPAVGFTQLKRLSGNRANDTPDTGTQEGVQVSSETGRYYALTSENSNNDYDAQEPSSAIDENVTKGTYTCTMTGATAGTRTQTLSYDVNGDMVTVYFPGNIFGDTTSVTGAISFDLPFDVGNDAAGSILSMTNISEVGGSAITTAALRGRVVDNDTLSVFAEGSTNSVELTAATTNVYIFGSFTYRRA